MLLNDEQTRPKKVVNDSRVYGVLKVVFFCNKYRHLSTNTAG